MPTLPDIQDFGQRPIPQSNRQVATVRNAGAVGEAVASLGEKVSAVVTHLEEVHDEDNVRRLDVEHAAAARKIRQTAREAQGINAEAARRAADEQLTELDNNILGQARSRTAREALSALVSRRSSVERDSITDYARTETTAAMTNAMTARIDTSLDEAEERWDNPSAMEASLTTALQEIDNRAQWQGADPATVANQRAQAISRVRSNVVEQYIQREDYDGANAYLETHRAEIDREQESALRRLVNGGLRDLADDRNAAWAISDRPASDAPAPASGDVPENAPPAPRTSDAPATPAPATPVRTQPRNEGNQPARFQIAGGFTVGDGYGARRGSGGTHHGEDMFAPTGTPFPIGRNFEIVESHRQQRVRDGRDGGNIATVRFADGSEWKAMHLPDLPRLGRYAAGAPVLRSGDSGSATAAAPHIHWQPANDQARAIYNQGRQVVATYLTGAAPTNVAQAPGTPAPDGTNIDLDRAYARIDALDLTPTARLRARNRVREFAAQNDVVRNRARADADEEITRALAAIAAGGGRVTNISQLPAGALTRASPNTVLQIQTMIEANNRPREPEANSPLMADLLNTAAGDPNRFLREVNPELYRGRITDDEVMQLHGMRNAIEHRDGPQPSQIMGMIRFVLPETGLVPSNVGDQRQGSGSTRETEAQARGRITDGLTSQIFSGVQQRLARNFPRGTQPSEQDILDAVRAEVTPIVVGGQNTRYYQWRQQHPGQEISHEVVTVPTRSIPSIDAVLRAAGLPLNAPNRIAEYLRHKSAYDAR